MGILGNGSRLHLGAFRAWGGGAVALARGNGSSNRSYLGRNWQNQEGAATVLAGAAFPTGYYPPATWRLPIRAGQMSFESIGAGSFTGGLVPANILGITLTGTGGITSAAGSLVVFLAAALSGSGALAAAIAALGNMGAALPGGGGLAGPLLPVALLGTSLSGSGGLAAGAVGLAPAAITLAGSGGLAAAILGLSNMLVTMTGSGSVTQALAALGNMQAALSGASSLTAAIQAPGNIGVGLNGAGGITALIGALGNMSITLTVTGTGLSTANVGQAVWASVASQNNTAASMGALLNQIALAAGLTPQQIRDAMALATAATVAAGSLDDQLTKIKANTNLIPAAL